MSSSRFHLQIGCIIPTRFDTTIDYFENGRFQWELGERDEFLLAVGRQMKCLADIWESLSGYRMKIVSRICMVDLPVKHLARKGDKKKLEIVTPAASEFRDCDALSGTMLYCFWIPYPPHIHQKLKGRRESSVKGHFARDTIWMPCHECREIRRTDFRRGLGHEFKHGLAHLLQQEGLNKNQLPNPDKDPKCRSKLVELLTNTKGFSPDPEW